MIGTLIETMKHKPVLKPTLRKSNAHFNPVGCSVDTEAVIVCSAASV